jgi:hypothetical protein
MVSISTTLRIPASAGTCFFWQRRIPDGRVAEPKKLVFGPDPGARRIPAFTATCFFWQRRIPDGRVAEPKNLVFGPDPGALRIPAFAGTCFFWQRSESRPKVTIFA